MVPRESVAGSPSSAQPRPSQPVAPAWLEQAVALRRADRTYGEIGAALSIRPQIIRRHLSRVLPVKARGHRQRPRGTDDASIPIRAIIGAGCAMHEIPCDLLLSRDRTFRVCVARQEIATAIVNAGHGVSAAARALCRDHSSICYAVDLVEADPKRMCQVRILAQAGTPQELPWFLSSFLTRAGALDPEQSVIATYVSVCLLGVPARGISGATLEQGRYLVARHYRAQVEAALTACGMAELCGLLAYHAKGAA